MKLKVCGLCEEANIREVLTVQPDFTGFIFYAKSPRYAGALDADWVKQLTDVQKVGVFVNATLNEMLEKAESYGLDFIQLHGDEEPPIIDALQQAGLKVIKVFRVSDALPENLGAYSPADYFLFDTQTKSYGGSGRQFDWAILNEVKHPFLLSGGIGEEDIAKIQSLDHPHLTGIDINSRVEVSPGVKDIDKIKNIKARI